MPFPKHKRVLLQTAAGHPVEGTPMTAEPAKIAIGRPPPNPLKIAMVAACPFPCPRGTPIRILRMAEALAERGHELHVVTYHLGDPLEDSPSITVHRTSEIKSYRRVTPGPGYRKLMMLDPLLAAKLGEVLRQHEIDLIHAHHYEGLLVAAWVRRKTPHPVIYDAHTLLESELPYYNMGLPAWALTRLGRVFDRRFPRWADHIITVTSDIEEKLVRDGVIPPERVSVVTNGVELHRFAGPSTNGKPAGRQGILIFTGNLAEYQGIDLLLKALRRILEVRPAIRLHIVSNSSFHRYEQSADQLRVRAAIHLIPSELSQLPGQLANADIALNPRTDCEGIPQKLLNYMAAGKPIVSFEGSAKLIEHGHTGWIVENDNIEAFANGVLTLLDEPRLARQLGDNARDLAKLYSWEQAAIKTEEVYRSVLKRARPGSNG